MTKTETRELICELAEHEMVERSIEQNNLMLQVVRLESQRRGINQDIKEKEERVDELRVIILSGEEKRQVECYWVYDWENRIKFLHRGDTNALLHQEPIRDYEKQGNLFPPPVVEDKALFKPCPSGPCVMVKNGETCKPYFCGKTPPKVELTESPPTQLFKIDAATCEHPMAMRFQDSNALVCEACGTVLEMFTTDPVELVTEASNEVEKQEEPETNEPQTETITPEEADRRAEICGGWELCDHKDKCFTPQNEIDGICFQDVEDRKRKEEEKAAKKLKKAKAA